MVVALTTRHGKATSSFDGIARSVQRARYTAGSLMQTTKPLTGRQDAFFVLGTSFASATLWRLFVLMFIEYGAETRRRPKDSFDLNLMVF